MNGTNTFKNYGIVVLVIGSLFVNRQPTCSPNIHFSNIHSEGNFEGAVIEIANLVN